MLTIETIATVTLTISPKLNKETGKDEVLLRYRNTRKVALRAHTHTFILPKYFINGQILIKNRVITPEVRDVLEAKAQVDRLYTPELIGKTYTLDEANDYLIVAFENTPQGDKDEARFHRQRLRNVETGEEVDYDLTPTSLRELT